MCRVFVFRLGSAQLWGSDRAWSARNIFPWFIDYRIGIVGGQAGAFAYSYGLFPHIFLGIVFPSGPIGSSCPLKYREQMLPMARVVMQLLGSR